jgi:diadenosine tetraphosphate (Ap4A) HIT family hydrolase
VTPSQRLAELDEGNNPLMIARLKSGFAVMSTDQHLPGYCLLLAFPEVNHLTDLAPEARAQYLMDMSHLGEAVMGATECLRINYSILGNVDPFLHAHVFPRYKWEEDQYRLAPPTDYPADFKSAHSYNLDKHDDLRLAIQQRLLAISGADLEP